MLPTFTGEVESAGYDIEGDTWAKGCVDVIHTQSHRHTYFNNTHKQTHVHQQIACKKCLYQKFMTLRSECEQRKNWPLCWITLNWIEKCFQPWGWYRGQMVLDCGGKNEGNWGACWEVGGWHQALQVRSTLASLFYQNIPWSTRPCCTINYTVGYQDLSHCSK